MKKHILSILSLASLGVFSSNVALAEQYRSAPWQMGFQEAGSPTAERLFAFHDMLLYIETGIVLFVLAIMAYIVVKFNAKANPTPSKTTHNSLLEVVWTVLPILILVAITIPSLKLLYFTDRAEDPELTVKVIGNQWYWTYAFPDNGNFEFDSYMLEDDDLEEGQPRLLSVDEPLVLPIGTNIRFILHTTDVIHNFAVPSLGLKLDTTPGRANETWTNITKPGDYYGMCSELCGVNHGFMPVHVKAVSKEDFEAWVVEAAEEFASNDDVDFNMLKLATDLTSSITTIISQ